MASSSSSRAVAVALLATIVAACDATPVVAPVAAPSPSAAAAPAPPPVGREDADARPVVGLVPSTDPAVTAALAEGAALALDEAQSAGGPDLTLVVGAASSHWSSVASEAVRLACEERVVALISPPERALAHPVAQAATRCRVPAISTSRAASVTAAGSRWVLSVIDTAATTDPATDAALGPSAIDPASPGAAPFAAAFRARFGRDPAPWAAEGYDAARVVAEAVRRGGLSRDAFVASLSRETPVTGATGLIRFDRLGKRESAAK